MSLTDLKKSKKPAAKKKTFTVDEFISDAENYAKGRPGLVSSEHHKNLPEGQKTALDLRRAIEQRLGDGKNTESGSLTAEQEEASLASKPFRHATFTLSEEAIQQLQHLANESKLAKSHIIRILISELGSKEQQEQLKMLLSSDIN